MNLNLAENTNKLILLVVAAVALLLTLNTYQKQIGKSLAVVLSIVTIVVVGYVGFNLMDSKAPSVNNVNVNSANNVNLVPNVDELVDEALEEELNDNGGSLNLSLTNNNPNNNLPEEEDIVEGFEDGANDVPAEDEDDEALNNAVNNAVNNVANNAVNNTAANEVVNNTNHPATTGVLNCKELLPSGDNTTWAQVSPSGVGDICTRNLLNAGHHIGVNTQGCSMRNANRGLRSEPHNPQVPVSPWLNTTICPDTLRRPLE